MVKTDGIHLVGDTIEELHEFAQKIGIKRCWFSNKRGKNHPHYDFPKRWRGDYAKRLARSYGATVCTTKELL